MSLALLSEKAFHGEGVGGVGEVENKVVIFGL